MQRSDSLQRRYVAVVCDRFSAQKASFLLKTLQNQAHPNNAKVSERNSPNLRHLAPNTETAFAATSGFGPRWQRVCQKQDASSGRDAPRRVGEAISRAPPQHLVRGSHFLELAETARSLSVRHTMQRFRLLSASPASSTVSLRWCLAHVVGPTLTGSKQVRH